jgi:hypothetical protein
VTFASATIEARSGKSYLLQDRFIKPQSGFFAAKMRAFVACKTFSNDWRSPCRCSVTAAFVRRGPADQAAR